MVNVFSDKRSVIRGFLIPTSPKLDWIGLIKDNKMSEPTMQKPRVLMMAAGTDWHRPLFGCLLGCQIYYLECCLIRWEHLTLIHR